MKEKKIHAVLDTKNGITTYCGLYRLSPLAELTTKKISCNKCVCRNIYYSDKKHQGVILL